MIIRNTNEKSRGKESVNESIKTLNTISAEVHQCVLICNAKVSTSDPAARGRINV